MYRVGLSYVVEGVTRELIKLTTLRGETDGGSIVGSVDSVRSFVNF
jgi:hypothetical protein